MEKKMYHKIVAAGSVAFGGVIWTGGTPIWVALSIDWVGSVLASLTLGGLMTALCFLPEFLARD